MRVKSHPLRLDLQCKPNSRECYPIYLHCRKINNKINDASNSKIKHPYCSKERLEKRQIVNDLNFKMVISSLPNRTLSILALPYNIQISQNFPQTLALNSKMSSWTCSKCTFINPPTQKSSCEICLSIQPQSIVLLSSSPKSSPSNPKWSCASCTFLNPYCSTICEICGTRASASLRSTIEIDDDDADEAQLGPAVGSVFLPLRGCSSIKKENSRGDGGDDTDISGELNTVVSSFPRRENVDIGIKESQSLGNCGNGKSDSGEKKSFFTVLRPCSNKRKDMEEGCVNGDRSDVGSSSGFRAVKTLKNTVEAKPLGTFLIWIITTNLCFFTK